MVCAEVVLQEKFVAFGARHQRITAPDEPDARPIFFRARIFDRELKLFLFELIDDMPNDFFVRVRAGFDRLVNDLCVRLVELGIEGQPATADRFRFDIDRVTSGDACATVHVIPVARHRRVISKLAFVSPLLAVDVMP